MEVNKNGIFTGEPPEPIRVPLQWYNKLIPTTQFKNDKERNKMAFSTTYEERETIIPEGEYECIITSASVNVTPGGTPFFSVRLMVRNDVPQDCQNRYIFHAIWEKKEENQTDDDKKVGGYSFKQLMNISQCAGIPKGKSYETLDDLGSDLKGKCVRANVYHDEWNGKTNVRVKWFNATKYPDCKHTFKTSDNSSASTAGGQPDTIVILPDDKDLPF